MNNADETLESTKSNARLEDTHLQHCPHIYKLKISKQLNKTASLSRTYSQIYEKYGYPTYKLSKSQASSKVQLSKPNESDFFPKANSKSCLSEDGGYTDTTYSDTNLPSNFQLPEDSSNNLGSQNELINCKACFRKKRRKRKISICISNCRYSSVRRVAASFDMKEVTEDDAWNFYWTDMSISIERAKEMKRFQRINHFPGMLEICRKDLLARNLNRMQKSFPKEYNFFPKSWCLPTELNDALNYNKLHKNKTFIIKPECGSQGRGIFLTKNLKDLKISERLICQQYVSKPYLIDGYKFDIRVYTLITSCDPLRIFVYNEGLVRFATSRYADPNSQNTTNVFMHLTNYAVNRHSRTFVTDNDNGSKRKISTLNVLLRSQGVDTDKMWYTIDQAIVKTVISAWPILRHSYKACFPSHDTIQACFEVLGFDILLDQNLQPYILEVNHSPSFHTETALDKEVKDSLLTDTFNLLNIWQCDRRKVIEEDRRRIKERLLSKTPKGYIHDKYFIKEEEKSPWLAQIQWEEDHLGNFRRVYPSGDEYAEFFQQPSSSLYTSTASSRLRGDCARQQREEIEQAKAKAEALKRLPFNNFKEVVESDTSNNKLPKEIPPINQATKDIIQVHEKKEKRQKSHTVKIFARNSFEPLPIVESEERERITQLARRDFLIRSYGLLEQIYQTMKQVGTLRPQDRQKYGLYDRVLERNVMNRQSETNFNINKNVIIVDKPQGDININTTINPKTVPHAMPKVNPPIFRDSEVTNNYINQELKCSEMQLYEKSRNSYNLYDTIDNGTERKSKNIKSHTKRLLCPIIKILDTRKAKSVAGVEKSKKHD